MCNLVWNGLRRGGSHRATSVTKLHKAAGLGAQLGICLEARAFAGQIRSTGGSPKRRVAQLAMSRFRGLLGQTPALSIARNY
jgi:hypothetical protein